MLMKSPLCAVLAAASLLAAASPAFAEDDAAVKARVTRRVDQIFSKLDTDHDGRISRDEGAKGPKLAKHFDRVDANHDGFVTRDEMSVSVERAARRRAAKGSRPTGPAPAPTNPQ